MTQRNELQNHPIDTATVVRRMVAGAVLALLLISLFLIGAGEPNPEWPKYWRIRPLLVVPFAGAMAGLCSYIIFHYRGMVGIPKVVAFILSVIVTLVGLWLGFVLGLAGTMWN